MFDMFPNTSKRFMALSFNINTFKGLPQYLKG